VEIEGIREALKAITVPETGDDIVSAGVVSDVELDGGEATVVLSFSGWQRAARHAVEDAVESRLSGLEGITDVTVDVIVEGDAMIDAAPGPRPAAAEPPAHSHPQPPQEAPAGGGPLKGVQNLIAVASGKGGVGKSTVAVNLALGLKRRGARVGLLDVDIYGPSTPILLGVPDARPGVSSDQKRFLPVDAYGLKVMSIGFLVDDDTPVIWRGPIVASVVKQFIDDVDWGTLDYIVIDLPPGTGDAQLTLTQTAPITGVLIVTTPSELALVDAVKGLQMFRKVDTPVIGIVENMSHYACPKCGHQSQPFNGGTTDRVADQFGVKLLARLPMDEAIQRGGDTGKPVTAEDPEGPQAAAFLSLADAVIETCPYSATPDEEKKSGFLSSLFRR